MKLATVSATFPELRGPFSQKTGRGKGTNKKSAVSRAFGDLMKQVSRKQFTSIRCLITIVEIQE